jgi:type II restriction/modification system DNA methylase subunit YeeA
VLDPACGSGNFLIVSLWALKDLEFEAIQWGSLVLQRPMQVPQIGPEAVLGIEINPYAAELARVTIWIGEIQWMIRHGLGYRRDPILRPLHHIETRDALLNLTDPTNPQEAEWPEAEFIVGNPPFLGGKWIRRGLGAEYVEALFNVYNGRVPREADLVSYWHEKARAQIAAGRTKRAGLLATQAIRAGANRSILERISRSGGLFFARSSEKWVLQGANVHISFVGQDDGSDRNRELDGIQVVRINSNLTTGVDLTRAVQLAENQGRAFMADTKGGPFDISADLAASMLQFPNPDGRHNEDVVRPWMNGEDLTGRPRGMWIIDFGVDMTEADAALYEAPFEYVRTNVRPFRLGNARANYRDKWWLHYEPRPGMRAATSSLSRLIATPQVSKHRLFTWIPAEVLADHRLIVIAAEDDYTFGVVHSRAHEAWSLAQGARHETRPTYNSTTCFETFPFPHPTDEQRKRVGETARRLVELRDGWLNPPGLAPADLEKRTLTNLYNQRPTWLGHAHAALDAAVFEAYGWSADLTNTDVLERLLALNVRASGSKSPYSARPASADRGFV